MMGHRGVWRAPSSRGWGLFAALLALAMAMLSSPAAATFRSGSNDWHTSNGWCYHAGSQLYVGDFNRDGRDDLLCHDTGNGYKWIDYANGNGRFGGTDWEGNLRWCYHPGSQLLVGDFNRDGRDDLLCHDTGNGYKWIDYANGNGRFGGTNWEADLRWCNHPGTQLYVGDFDRDRRTDLLCHDATGHKWVALANASHHFTGTSWESDMQWCNHSGARLFIGDYNGDRRDDMLCHDTNNGWKWIVYSDL